MTTTPASTCRMKNRKLKTFLSIRTSNESFHACFPEAEETEEVVAAFNCAHSKDILHQGKLYVTPSHFYFHSNIFGFEEKITIDCHKITSITREKAALFFPTAILVRCEETKYLFASFMSREQVYRLMFRVWQSVLLGNPLSAEELSQSKKFGYRRLEREVTQVNDNSGEDVELTRSQSTDDPGIFAESAPTHTETRHRRTKSDGHSISSSQSFDDNFHTRPVISPLQPRIRVSTSALSDGERTPKLFTNPPRLSQSLSPDKLRVSFDVRQSSDADSTSGMTPFSDAEESRTDLSTDQEEIVSPVTSQRKEDKPKKKKGKFTKFFHFRLPHKEIVSHKGSHSHVESALNIALSSAVSAAPCALPKKRRSSFQHSSTLQATDSNEVQEQAESQESKTYSAEEQSGGETSFQARLKRIPLQIKHRVSGVLQFLMTKLQSSLFASLLMIVTIVFVILVCCSTALLACQMTRFDPVLASVYPLRELCSSNDLHNRRSSSVANVEEMTVDKLTARLKSFSVQPESHLPTNDAPETGASSTKPTASMKSVHTRD
ncbi:uncharacterized protein LOC134192651 isoform X2 [Corticium candelabrum]|uniref:uncharacterized protein LOC134192651 isoform X2 n=1 Tax=Corticium candelabrum TaxID=121492 RepID=UPI002E266399|nr:uncharacterized protein LOC134192651 isoform X2 [Corticium candelabrum]